MIELHTSNLTNGSTATPPIRQRRASPGLLGTRPLKASGPWAPSPLLKAAFAAAKAKGLKENTVTSLKGWIIVPNGDYLCAVGGAGIGSPSGGDATALRTDAKRPGKLGIFRIKVRKNSTLRAPGCQFALQTRDGSYVTAVNGGGIGNNPKARKLRQPIVTNARQNTRGTLFTILERADGTVTILTANGHYVTATKGGGIGGSNLVPIHTTAKRIGKNELFRFDPLYVLDTKIHGHP